MEGGELKRQRRESSSIQVTQGDNAPLLVQDSVGAQIFFVLVLVLCVSFFSRLFFLFSFFRLFFFFKILPKKFSSSSASFLEWWYYYYTRSTLRL